MTGVASIGATTPVPLPEVTLCAVTSVNVAVTVQALTDCLEQVSFGACKLFTDTSLPAIPAEITVVPIEYIGSSSAYSDFVLTRLVEHVETSHCLVVQWDGHVINGSLWQPQFLDYDYIGASWPQFDDGYDVGNGGFSLRSRRLMEACQHRDFLPIHPEDVAIGRENRAWLESLGMRFAPRELADTFATERTGDVAHSFGYHGVFNMPAALGVDAFWERYCKLDERSTVWADLNPLLRMLAGGANPTQRRLRMVKDWIKDSIRAQPR